MPLVTPSKIVQARKTARPHTFMDIDCKITSTAILSSFAD